MSKDIIYFAENICGIILADWQKDLLRQTQEANDKGELIFVNLGRRQGGQLLNTILINFQIWSKNQQISDLKRKLAKSEKSKEINIKERDKICIEMATDYNRQILELKQQLAEKEKDLIIKCKTIGVLVEKNEQKDKLAEKEKSLSIKSIIRTLIKHNNLKCTFRDNTMGEIQQCGDVYNSNYGYFNFEDDYDESLNNKTDSRFDIISIDLDNQDKISFAIEKLNLLYKTLTTENVWKVMKKGWWLINGECLQLRQIIDQQIKQLKENKSE